MQNAFATTSGLLSVYAPARKAISILKRTATTARMTGEEFVVAAGFLSARRN
jgi:hypothetical protein